MSKPRAYTEEEVRDILINSFRSVAQYWAALPDVDKATGRTMSIRDRCDGVAFSILSTLDGTSLNFPAVDLKLAPHPEDKEFLKAEGMNWFEPGMEISTTLHEFYYVRKENG